MSFEEFELTDADVPAAVAMCMKLDGLPLAIELAAGRIGPFGIRELARRLDDRFTLLAQGRRTALPRHQTLRATLDWSYGILPEHEQAILRRLAVFCGEFTMDSAEAVTASDGIGSLARLWSDQHRVGAARELLSGVRDRFGEGFQTRDCLRADALLQELRALQDIERDESTVSVA